MRTVTDRRYNWVKKAPSHCGYAFGENIQTSVLPLRVVKELRQREPTQAPNGDHRELSKRTIRLTLRDAVA